MNISSSCRTCGGDAWFDNVAVWQLPFVQVASQSAVNVVRGGDGPSGAAGRPRLDVTVRDVVGSRLTVDLRTFDHTLREVAAERRALADTGPTRWTWTPDLPGYGWYLTELTVWEGGRPPGRTGWRRWPVSPGPARPPGRSRGR